MSYEPDAEAQAAIARHMNEDHADDGAVIARAYSGNQSITDAEVTGVDGLGMDLTAETPDGQVVVRVPWSGPLADRAAVRLEVVRAYEWAHEQAGS